MHATRIVYVFYLLHERVRFKLKIIDRIHGGWMIVMAYRLLEDNQEAILLNARLIAWDVVNPLLELFIYLL